MPNRRTVHVSPENLDRLSALIHGRALTLAQISVDTGLSATAIRSGLESLPRMHKLREGRQIYYYQRPLEAPARPTKKSVKKVTASPAKKGGTTATKKEPKKGADRAASDAPSPSAAVKKAPAKPAAKPAARAAAKRTTAKKPPPEN